MREHEINKQPLFIKGWYIDHSLCDKIVNHFNSVDHRRGTSGNGLVNLEVKDSYDSFLNENQELYEEYISNVFQLRTQYSKYYDCDIENCVDLEFTNIQKYNPGGGYHAWHSEWSADSYETSMRRFVFMTYLNDVMDGGETEFLYQNLKVKPQKGLTLIWTSDWTHTHKGNVSSFDKYIVTGWLSHYNNQNIETPKIRVGDVIDLSKFGI